MNLLDWIILVVLVVSAFSGLKRGLIKTVVSLVGLVIGIVLAGQFDTALAAKLTFIPQPVLARTAAFVIILVGAMVASGWAASLLKSLASRLLLGWADRVGGAVIGLVLGGAIIGALLAMAAKFPFFNLEGSVGGSWLAAILLDKFPIFLAFLPEDFDRVREFFQ
ncbi:MAG: CvpA family protein [Dehalococcoidia bacterium]